MGPVPKQASSEVERLQDKLAILHLKNAQSQSRLLSTLDALDEAHRQYDEDITREVREREKQKAKLKAYMEVVAQAERQRDDMREAMGLLIAKVERANGNYSSKFWPNSQIILYGSPADPLGISSDNNLPSDLDKVNSYAKSVILSLQKELANEKRQREGFETKVASLEAKLARLESEFEGSSRSSGESNSRNRKLMSPHVSESDVTKIIGEQIRHNLELEDEVRHLERQLKMAHPTRPSAGVQNDRNDAASDEVVGRIQAQIPYPQSLNALANELAKLSVQPNQSSEPPYQATISRSSRALSPSAADASSSLPAVQALASQIANLGSQINNLHLERRQYSHPSSTARGNSQKDALPFENNNNVERPRLGAANHASGSRERQGFATNALHGDGRGTDRAHLNHRTPSQPSTMRSRSTTQTGTSLTSDPRAATTSPRHLPLPSFPPTSPGGDAFFSAPSTSSSRPSRSRSHAASASSSVIDVFTEQVDALKTQIDAFAREKEALLDVIRREGLEVPSTPRRRANSRLDEPVGAGSSAARNSSTTSDPSKRDLLDEIERLRGMLADRESSTSPEAGNFDEGPTLRPAVRNHVPTGPSPIPRSIPNTSDVSPLMLSPSISFHPSSAEASSPQPLYRVRSSHSPQFPLSPSLSVLPPASIFSPPSATHSSLATPPPGVDMDGFASSQSEPPSDTPEFSRSPSPLPPPPPLPPPRNNSTTTPRTPSPPRSRSGAPSPSLTRGQPPAFNTDTPRSSGSGGERDMEIASPLAGASMYVQSGSSSGSESYDSDGLYDESLIPLPPSSSEESEDEHEEQDRSPPRPG